MGPSYPYGEAESKKKQNRNEPEAYSSEQVSRSGRLTDTCPNPVSLSKKNCNREPDHQKLTHGSPQTAIAQDELTVTPLIPETHEGYDCEKANGRDQHPGKFSGLKQALDIIRLGPVGQLVSSQNGNPATSP